MPMINDTNNDLPPLLLDIATFTRVLMSQTDHTYDAGLTDIKRKQWRDTYGFFIIGLMRSGKLTNIPVGFERLAIEIQTTPHYQVMPALACAKTLAKPKTSSTRPSGRGLICGP